MEPLIIDPTAPGGFRSASTGGGDRNSIHVVDMPPMDDYRDDIPRERRPSMAQRMSSMSIQEVERRPSSKGRRESVITITPKPAYSYWKLEKEGDDWQRARRSVIPAPQEEVEKLAKKGKGTVSFEASRMGSLRRQHLQRLVDHANDEETGDAVWEPVFIDVNRIVRRKSNARSGGVPEVKSMDVVLARVTPSSSSPKGRSKSRSRSIVGQLIDVSERPKSMSISKGKDTDKGKEKKKEGKNDDGDRDHKRKESVIEDDPFFSQKHFDRTGKPMDDRGVLEFANGGLPEEIPRDKPIGARIEKKKEDKRDKRGKSQDRGGDGIVRMDDLPPLGALAGGADTLDAILGVDPRNRRGSSARRSEGHIEVAPGQRSRSRRRSQSHRRSASRPESIRFPPNYHTRSWMGDGGSSDSSGESRYGLDREERSSYTSQDTYHSMTGRGSRYDDAPRRERGYKVHRRGSTNSRPRTYYDDHQGYDHHRERRYSNRYEVIPESRQIGYGNSGNALVRRPTEPRSPTTGGRRVELHYPNETVDLRARERTAESYMRDNVRDEFLDIKERDILRREQAVADAEYETQRQREYEQRRYPRDYDGGHYYR